jgi:hypothetical protein
MTMLKAGRRPTEKVEDRLKWKAIVEKAKTLPEL